MEATGVVQPGGDDDDGALLELPEGCEVERLMVGMDGGGGPGVGRVQVAEVALEPGLCAE